MSRPDLAQQPTALAVKRRARAINRELAKVYPDAHCELDFNNPLELTVATVLSAQCTDVRVNQVTPALFAKYPTAEAYASANEAELQEMIRPTGFYKAKAAHLIGMGQKLVTDFSGEIPRDLEHLVSLPGVGRKTAHVVRGNAFDIPGLTVDTHFGRLVRRLGLTTQTNPVKVEHEIADLIEKKRMDHVLTSDHLPRTSRMPFPHRCMWSVLPCAALPKLRGSRTHRSTESRNSCHRRQPRTPTSDGRYWKCVKQSWCLPSSSSQSLPPSSA